MSKWSSPLIIYYNIISAIQYNGIILVLYFCGMENLSVSKRNNKQ